VSQFVVPSIDDPPSSAKPPLKDAPSEKVHWPANLDLSFVSRECRTVLAAKSHRGPLQIQKALYPEGPEVCHVTVLHPPGGIVEGDALTIGARLASGSRVCLTTPGASKWYRCPHAAARQQLSFSLAGDAILEWLPRENILFDASLVRMSLDVDMAPRAQYLGWEILCFGRRAGGERWLSGGLRLRSTIRQGGRILFAEHADLKAGDGFDSSPVGLAGYSVSATLIAAGANIDSEVLATCRSMAPCDRDSRVGITVLPKVLLGRYLGQSSQDAFNWCASLWKVLRPSQLGLAPNAPRLWAC
jgi:urease accessory protein